MNIKDIKLYTIEMHWTDAPNVTETKTVAVGIPDFLEEDRPYEDWTEAEEDFDNRIFHYYDDYEEFIDHLKDGDNVDYEEFIVTKIINKQLN